MWTISHIKCQHWTEHINVYSTSYYELLHPLYFPTIYEINEI